MSNSSVVLVCVATLSLLAGCRTQTSVQSEYISMRDMCQGQAEAEIGNFPNTDDVRDRNAKLVTLFSECMFDNGWTVAAPKREGEEETASIIPDPQNPQNQSSDPAAAAVMSARSYPAENQAIIQGQTTPSTQPLSGSPNGYSLPAPVPAASQRTPATYAPMQSNGAYYQYPDNYQADPGVGVGASIKPGRDFVPAK